MVAVMVSAWRQHRLKPTARPTRARITPPELLHQFLVAMDHAQAALHARLGVEIPADACSLVQKQNPEAEILVGIAASCCRWFPIWR
jgi:hypothetical protein